MQVSSEEKIEKLDIESFVHNATWRELLIELVETKKLDPWDIDISKMLDGYIEIIKTMKTLDLRVPANIILAASILLRMKSETLYLSQLSMEQDEQADTESNIFVRPDVEVPNLLSKIRMQPHRRITLQELIDSVDSAMKVEEKRREHFQELDIPINIPIGDDIDKRTERVRAMLNENVDKLGMTTFTILSERFSSVEEKLLDLFVPLLFLAQEESVSLVQEEFFKEIIIKVLGN